MKKSLLISSLRFAIRVFFHGYEIIADWRDKLIFRYQAVFLTPAYQRQGRCQQTGQCCRALGLAMPRWCLRWPKLVVVLRYWYALRYNFEYQGLNDNVLIYRCRELLADNRCGIHRFKPKLCRDYPQPLFKGLIHLHKGCGYVYVSHQNVNDDEPKLTSSEHAQAVVLTERFQKAMTRQSEAVRETDQTQKTNTTSES